MVYVHRLLVAGTRDGHSYHELASVDEQDRLESPLATNP
jgi:hypothetical protein